MRAEGPAAHARPAAAIAVGLTSNFSFLQAEFPAVFEAARQAEAHGNSDARAACFYARRALELAVTWLYRHDRSLRMPYREDLAATIHEPGFQQAAGAAISSKARLIKDLGNRAVHDARPMQPGEALAAMRELFYFGYWLARSYARSARPAPDLAFDAALLPQALGKAPQQSTEQLLRLQA